MGNKLFVCSYSVSRPEIDWGLSWTFQQWTHFLPDLASSGECKPIRVTDISDVWNWLWLYRVSIHHNTFLCEEFPGGTRYDSSYVSAVKD